MGWKEGMMKVSSSIYLNFPDTSSLKLFLKMGEGKNAMRTDIDNVSINYPLTLGLFTLCCN